MHSVYSTHSIPALGGTGSSVPSSLVPITVLVSRANDATFRNGRCLRGQKIVAKASNNSDEGSSLGKILKSVQGALPVVGLLTRLTSAEGGVGNDSIAYPEYCRKVYETSPVGFQEAVADLQNKYGNSAQRRYVLLSLWMIKEGNGLVSNSLILDSARRVRVSQDVEFEMERFLGAYKEESNKYTYIKDRPSASLQEQAHVAVDALARLILPIQDGEPIPEEDAPLIEDAVVGGLLGYPEEEFRACVQNSIATRESRYSQ